MKIKINKHFGLITGIVLLLGSSSCIKDKGYKGETDFSNLQDHVTIVKGGLTYYSSAGVIFSGSDTANMTLMVNLASVNLPKAPVNVTIGVDAAKIAEYNAANNTNFQPVPTGSYKIASTTLTIPAGQQYAQTTVSFYKAALDPSVSYMLPVSITDASGKALTSNMNTAYYHVIGNPIAGNYEIYFSRWLAADSTGAPNYHNSDQGSVTFSPSTPTRVTTDGVFGDQVIIDFTNSGGVLSNFKASFPAGTAAAVGVTSWGPPVVEVADPIHGYYKIYFQYVNSVGTRTVVYQYVKQ